MLSLPPVHPSVHLRLSSFSRENLEQMLFRCHQLLNLYADPYEDINDRDALLGEIWRLLSDSLYGPGTLSSFDELLSRDPRSPSSNREPALVDLQTKPFPAVTDADLIKACNLVSRRTGDRAGPQLSARPSAQMIRRWLIWNDPDGDWDFLQRVDDEFAMETLRNSWTAADVRAWLEAGQ